MEKNEDYSVMFQVHLFFTFFLFLLLPHIANHFEPDLSKSALLALALLNALLGLALCISEGRILMPCKSALLFFYSFCLYVIGHYYFSAPSEEGRQFVNGIVIIMLFTFNLSQACRTKKIALLLVSGVIINGLLQIIIGVNQQFYTLPELQALIQKNPQIIKEYAQGNQEARYLERINGGLPYGSFIYPNTLGAYLGLFLFAIMSLFVLLKPGKFSVFFKLLLPIFIVSGLICIFLTEAKGVWISLIMVLFLGSVLYFAFLKFKEIKPSLYFKIGLGLFIVILSAPFLFKNVLSMKVRLNYWQAGWDMFISESSYLLGLGAGGFTNNYMKYKLPFGEEVQKAHNYFVTVLVEQGVLGLILFLMFLGSLLYFFIKNNSSANGINEEDDKPMPQRVYLLLFYFIFAVFMMVNPAITEITDGLTFLTLYTLIVLFLIITFRFLIYRNVFKCLPMEENLLFQILILGSCMLVCFTDLINAFLNLDHWPNFEEFTYKFPNFPAITVFILLILFFSFIYKKGGLKHNVSNGDNPLSKNLGILLVVYFILMIGGDMVGEYVSFVVTFIALVLVFEKHAFNISAEIKLPNLISILFFLILSFGFALFIFEKIVLPDINISRYHYLYEHWNMNSSFKKEGVIETKESILETGQSRYPEHLYFPLEKAKLYSAIGRNYLNKGLKQNAYQWYGKAIKEIDLCIKISPKKAMLYEYKADLLEDLEENFQEVEALRLKALDLYPTKANYHFKLASFYKKTKNVERALKYYYSSIYLQKNSNRYTLLNIEEYEEAIRYTVENDPKSDYNSTPE